jgi:SAM-dependent methyltransferase
MDAYTSFAEVYDLFMDNVPYEEWANYLCDTLKEFHIEEGILLELGCGTGKMTRLLAKRGYDMIGVDNSIEMLDIARSRQGEEIQQAVADGALLECGQQSEMERPLRKDAPQILYLLQDMREFELYGTVRAVYSACDCLNYILEEDELRTVFALVNNYLDPHGIFIFDMNTAYKYEELLADNTFAENRDEGSFIWENYFDPESGINEYDLTLFVRERGAEDKRSEESAAPFWRFQETHYQRSYSAQQIRRLLEEAGMEFLAVYDGYTKEPLRADSERMTIIAREKGKTPEKKKDAPDGGTDRE